MQNETRWQDITIHLKEKGFEVYSPGTKTGECKTQYLVIKNEGSNNFWRTRANQEFYSILCYVPQNKYSNLEILINKVKEAMTELWPMIQPCGTQSTSYYDDDKKAHMMDIVYYNPRFVRLGGN